MATLEGILERITYHSEVDGYTVARVQPRGKTYLVTIVGRLIGAQVGESLELEGRWVDHPEHGRQFEVERYRTVLPATVEGIRRYLGSGLIKGIGPVTARRIVETFGVYTLHVIDHEPHRLREVPTLGPKRVERITRAWQEQQQIKEIMVFLQELAISPGLAVRIYKQYGDQSMSVVQETPYRLADEIFGIGFLTADKIAQALGIPHDSPQRIGAGLRFALSQATDEGHCYLPWEELLTRATKLLEVEPQQVGATLDTIAITGEVHVETRDGQRAVYLLPFFHAERGVAARVRELLHAPSRIAGFFREANWPRVFAHLADRRGLELTPLQQQAVQMALTNKVSVLTGGPGTGKCVRGDTLVATASGLVPISDLMPSKEMQPDTALPINTQVQTRSGLKTATHFYYGGVRETLQIATAEGIMLEGTPNHRVIVATEHGPNWKRLDQISECDYVAIFRQNPCYEYVFDSFAYFLGLFTGDGNYNRVASAPITGIVITSADAEVWDFVESELPKMNLTVSYKSDSGLARCYYVGRRRRYGGGGGVALMKEWGCNIATSRNKNIPSSILTGNFSQKRSFLQGLFDADGTADLRDGTVELGMSNENLLRVVQQILLQFGIVSILKEKKSVNSWRLTCRGENARLFFERIGFRIKRKRLLNLVEEYTIKSYEECVIRSLCDSKIYWSRVAEIKTSQTEVYDLHVPDGNEFIANGLVNHNTTTLRTVILALEQRGCRYLLASPTGRAAKRLSEATGAPAATIHRLLEFTPVGGPHFKRNEDFPLEADVVVVDEVSMLDVLLANSLLKAIPREAHVLLVGDADQLPSVGPGRVLRDMLDSAAVPSIHLDAIFRQAGNSGIITNAHRINHGEFPHTRGLEDFFFFPASDPDACAELTADLVARRIPQRFGLDPRRDIQVLSPTHRGQAGVASLNTLLQQALNPPAAGRAEHRMGGTVFRVGDRVLQLRNNYDLEVYNGDIGEVVAIDPEEQLLTVGYDGEREVAYDFGLLDELTLAYAISVHKSQGAEYSCVVIPLLTQHYTLLQRNLLYTGVTRARRLVVLVGDKRAIAIAVNNNRVELRYTGLAGRLGG